MLPTVKHNTPTRTGRILVACCCAVVWISGGCGFSVSTDFAGRLMGAGGETIVAEDVNAIVADPNLSDDEKRAALRDLGIEDEKLIDALLTL